MATAKKVSKNKSTTKKHTGMQKAAYKKASGNSQDNYDMIMDRRKKLNPSMFKAAEDKKKKSTSKPKPATKAKSKSTAKSYKKK